MAPRTALIVGNGLTLDLLSRSAPALLQDWHPSRPLAFPVTVPDGRPLLDCLPRFSEEVDRIRTDTPGVSDFAVIDEAVRRSNALMASEGDCQDGMQLIAELRHFLGLAYAGLDRELMDRATVEEW